MGFWDDVSKGVTDAAKAAKEAADDAAKVVGTKLLEQKCSSRKKLIKSRERKAWHSRPR